MADRDRRKMKKIPSKKPVNYPAFSEWGKQSSDWFDTLLKYQAQSNALFEYILMEDGNGR
jgi:hypothetical protein